MYEVIIVGSGAAGTAAALELVQNGIKPLMIDVGITNKNQAPRVKGNLYDYRKQHDSFELQIGDRFSGLANVFNEMEGIAKLNAPNMGFVTQSSKTLSPIEEKNFHAVQSFAFGGLGNAWGAGLYPFVDYDLTDFPITSEDLSPYFEKLTREIGISGADDDLTVFFGDPSSLSPPLSLSYNMSKVLERYQHQKRGLNRNGVYVGRPRLGVLSIAKDGIQPCDYNNLEFWQDLPYIYSPVRTLKKLIATRKLGYESNIFVKSLSETSEEVEVQVADIQNDTVRSFFCKKLLLAAGAINTSKIVLQSRRDYKTRLPLLENPVIQIPLILPSSIGRKLDIHAFGLVQLNLIWESQFFNSIIQGSIMELTSPMRAEFFKNMPLSAKANLRLSRYLLPAMVLMQLFFPSKIHEPSCISLGESGSLFIEGKSSKIQFKNISNLLSPLRLIGLWTHPSLIRQSIMGHAIHYAGTLPMKRSPKLYQCYPSGRLFGTRHVYIADSASFSDLPAKNMSFGMMANAMRIASCVLDELKMK